MDLQNLTLGLAFLAGLLSFASPCVLPLVPAYMGYLGGTVVMSGVAQARTRRETLHTFLHSVFFVLGFGLVFVLLGATATFLGRFVFDSSYLIQRVGGVLLVVFGMRLMGVGWSSGRWLLAATVVALCTFVLDSGLLTLGSIDWSNGGLFQRSLAQSLLLGLVVVAGADWRKARLVILAVAVGFLNYLSSYDTPLLNIIASVLIVLVVIFLNRADFFYAEKKIELRQTGQNGYGRSFLFGVVFAAGWTPCIGPILAAILVLAGQLETVGQGMLLLTAYTLGLGIPFLVMGLAFGPLSGWLRRMNRYLGIISVISGALLVLMGILIFTGSLAFLSQYGSFLNLEL